MPLSPLGTGTVEHVQFAPAAPLSEGLHELVVRTQETLPPSLADAGTILNSDERRIRFRVAAGPARDGDVTISSVQAYPITFRGYPPQRVSPPPEE